MISFYSRLRLLKYVLTALLITITSPWSAYAQEDNTSRDLANPFSNLWSIANQINFNQLKGAPLTDPQTQFNWNFQPVMPIPFNGQFNLVNRAVIPYYKSPFVDSTGDIQYSSGIGDIIFASLIVPNKAEGWIYGLGVTLQAPTASPANLGQGLWQAGPAAGLFYVSDHFVAGLFPQHWHSVGGTDDQHPATRFTNLQYAVNYLPTKELTISSSANILIDWTKDEANRWTVPLAIGATYLVHLGKLPIQIGASYQWVVKHPADIEHQDSIVRIIFTPVIPSPFAKKNKTL